MYYFLNKGGKAQSIYFRFDGHRGIRHIPPIWIKLQLVPWVSCVRTRCDRYLDCPKAAPHTPRDTDTSLWSSWEPTCLVLFPCLGDLRLRSKPPAAFWQRLYCQSRCSIHPITQRSVCATPPFVTVSPGSNYIPARNQQTHVRRQADTVSLVHCCSLIPWYTAAPSYPAVTEPLGTDAAWSLVGKAQALQTLRVPLLLSLNTCSFKGEWRNLGKSLSPTSNSSDKKPLQNETEM